jgi:hypothetical protein
MHLEHVLMRRSVGGIACALTGVASMACLVFNTVWAFATAGVRADALYAAVAEAAVGSSLSGFNSQNLANTV